VRRLLPEAGEVALGEVVGELRPAELAGHERPHVFTNFAITLDGQATIFGRSGPIGSSRDTEMLQLLRTQADAVMIGAGTLRAERYGRIVSDPELRARRESIGLAHDPLAVIVSGRLDLPWDAGLFTNGDGSVVVFTAADTEPPETATPVEVIRHEGAVDLVAALSHLRVERGIRALLCEGGPRLHAQLIDAGLVDVLFVTHAPKLAGGDGPGLVNGLTEVERPLELVWLLEEDGELFARDRVARPDEG
jgi:riboflavin-specific deaminase-like protein